MCTIGDPSGGISHSDSLSEAEREVVHILANLEKFENDTDTENSAGGYGKVSLQEASRSRSYQDLKMSLASRSSSSRLPLISPRVRLLPENCGFRRNVMALRTRTSSTIVENFCEYYAKSTEDNQHDSSDVSINIAEHNGWCDNGECHGDEPEQVNSDFVEPSPTLPGKNVQR